MCYSRWCAATREKRDTPPAQPFLQFLRFCCFFRFTPRTKRIYVENALLLADKLNFLVKLKARHQNLPNFIIFMKKYSRGLKFGFNKLLTENSFNWEIPSNHEILAAFECLECLENRGQKITLFWSYLILCCKYIKIQLIFKVLFIRS